jgi:SOS-response transcriptional repressor LexA
MKKNDLNRIKQFIRVSFEIEEALQVSTVQKKILLTIVQLWDQNKKAPPINLITQSVKDVSERSIYRHIKPLFQKGWIQIEDNPNDHRIKLIQPSEALLHFLSLTI